MTAVPYSIRPICGDPAETAAAVQLFRTVFGHATTTDQWHWKYQLAPGGIVLSHAAYDAVTGAMVGHVGALALPGLHQGQAVHMVQFTDVMVHPQARSDMGANNLYRRLMDSTLHAMHSRGTTACQFYAYGFPGKAPAHLGARMGFYKLLGYCQQQSHGHTPRRQLWPTLVPWDIVRISDASQIPPDLLRRAQQDIPGPHLIKDPGYIHWRYLACPDRAYQLWLAGPRWGRAEAWLVTRDTPSPHLIDLQLAAPHRTEKAMSCLVNALVRRSGIPQWTAWPTTPGPTHSATSLMAVAIGLPRHSEAPPVPAFQPGDTDVY